MSRFRVLLLACVAALAPVESSHAQAACPTAPTYAGPPRRQVPAGIWERDFSRPIDGSLDPALIVPLEDALDGILARVPAASVAVAIPGQGTWAATRGRARAGSDAEVTPAHRFQVASTTKTFVAATVLQLVAEGRTDLDAAVGTWFPDVPNAGVMTVRHLLRHQGGLVSFNALPDLGPGYRTPEETIALAAAEAPRFCPGTSWAYTNTGYAMLGRIVEAVAGAPLHEVLAARILDPLGLSSTVLRKPGVEAPVVSGHASGEPVRADDGYATPWAAGGLASTADDLVRFWHALLGGRVLAPEAVREMFSDLVPMGPGSPMYYGAGVQLYDAPDGPGVMLGHSGGITGFTAVVAYVAADDAYVAVLLNDKDTPAEAGLWALVRALREARAAER